MNTIFWLSVFMMVVGYGATLLLWASAAVLSKLGNVHQKAVIERLSWVDLTPWNFVLVGAVGTIIALTIK